MWACIEYLGLKAQMQAHMKYLGLGERDSEWAIYLKRANSTNCSVKASSYVS